MRRISMVKTLLLAGILSLGMVTAGAAQESDETDFAFGKVVRISSEEVVIMVYDFEQAKEVEEAFVINGESVLDGYGSIEDVQVGDDIDIEYAQADGGKIVRYLYRSDDTEMSEGDDQVELLDEVDSFIGDEGMQEPDEGYKDVE